MKEVAVFGPTLPAPTNHHDGPVVPYRVSVRYGQLAYQPNSNHGDRMSFSTSRVGIRRPAPGGWRRTDTIERVCVGAEVDDTKRQVGGWWWRSSKRTVDLILGSLVLVLVSPVLLVVATVLFVTCGRPITFRQERVGRGGRTFRMIKFRSMVVDAEEWLRRDPELEREYQASGYKLPIDRDPRITRAGRWLRRTSLDELPQLFNVIGGAMSLVGPRPVLGDELISLFGDDARLYLEMKPGLTGPWQVAGRSAVRLTARRQLDIDYYRNWTLSGDLRILAQTVPRVLRRSGAW